jgi:hypothetical protein
LHGAELFSRAAFVAWDLAWYFTLMSLALLALRRGAWKSKWWKVRLSNFYVKSPMSCRQLFFKRL